MSETAVRFEDVGKMYKVFASRRDKLDDALGMRRILPTRRDRYQDFWALRGIDFELRRGGGSGSSAGTAQVSRPC